MTNQVHALLMVQSADYGHNRFEIVLEQQAMTERFFIFILVINGINGKLTGNMRIGLRIPDIIIYTVQNAAEFPFMYMQGVLKTVSNL